MSAVPIKLQRVLIATIAAFLWIASAALGFFSIYSLFRLTPLLYALSTGKTTFSISENSLAVLIGQTTAIIGGIAWIIVVIGTGEYHLKHFGERKSWITFAWVLGVEIVLFLLGIFIL